MSSWKYSLGVVFLSLPSLCFPPGEPETPVTRDNPYEDVKLSPMCLPIARSHNPKVKKVEWSLPLPWESQGGRRKRCSMISCDHQKPSDNSTVHVFQLPPKPQTLQGYAGKVERKKFQTLTASKSPALADNPKLAAPRRASTQKTQRTPQVNSKWILSLVFTLTEVHVDQQSGVYSVDWWIICYVGKKRKGRLLVEQEGEDAERNR